MNTTEIRQKLHQFIDSANDRKIEGLYLLVADETDTSKAFELNPEQLDFLENERTLHLNEASTSYNWKEAKEMIKRGKEA